MKRFGKVALSTALITALLGTSSVAFASDAVVPPTDEVFDQYDTMLIEEDFEYVFEPMGPGLQIDGVNVEAEYPAKNVDGRIYLPLRETFEAMGATVDWNEETGLLTVVRGDTTLSFVQGEDHGIITENGVEKEVVIQHKSFVENGVTYLSARAAANAFGLDITWDGDEQMAIIVDREKLHQRYTDEFTIFDKMLKLYGSYSNGGYAYSGTMKFDFLYGSGAEIYPLEMEATYNGVIDTELDGIVDMAIDFNMEKLFQAMGATKEDIAELDALGLKARMSIEIDCIVDSQEGIIYMQSDALNQLMGLEKGVWMKIDANESLEDTGITYDELMDASMEVADTYRTYDLIDMVVEEYPFQTAYDYDAFTMIMDLLYDVLSDENFVRDEQGNYVNEKTYNFDDIGLDMSIGYRLEVQEVNGNVRVADIDVNFIFGKPDYTEGIALDFCYLVNNTGFTKEELDFNMNMEGMVLKFYIYVDGQYTKSNEQVEPTVPQGAQVVDYFEVIETNVAITTAENAVLLEELPEEFVTLPEEAVAQ